MLDFDTILTQLPSLKKLLDTYGDMSLFEYAQKHYIVTEDLSLIAQGRKQEFLDFLQGYVEEKFGRSYAQLVIPALSKNYAVSTAEHHGPMGHPFFFQSALLRAITQSELPVVNFATSHVSLGNSSYPRGLVFHADIIRNRGEIEQKQKIEKGSIGFGNQLNQQNQLNASNSCYIHLPFFGSKSRMSPVFGLPAYTKEDIEEHCLKRIKTYKKEHFISDEMEQKLLEYVQKYILDDSILTCQTYSEQITRLNHIWWGDMFPDLPPYISLDAEDIVVQLLQKHLQEGSSFSRLILENALQPTIEEAFDGISCCFERKTKKGTYLFWYLDEHHKRHALWREGDELVSKDNSFRMKMTQEEYLYHLRQRHLIPSGLLVYTLFVCYYGVTCFGGFAQGEYLPQIQNAFAKVMTTSFKIKTSILNEDMVFLYEKNCEISTALDMFIGDSKGPYILASQGIKIKDSMYKMEYEIARCF